MDNLTISGKSEINKITHNSCWGNKKLLINLFKHAISHDLVLLGNSHMTA